MTYFRVGMLLTAAALDFGASVRADDGSSRVSLDEFKARAAHGIVRLPDGTVMVPEQPEHPRSDAFRFMLRPELECEVSGRRCGEIRVKVDPPEPPKAPEPPEPPNPQNMSFASTRLRFGVEASGGNGEGGGSGVFGSLGEVAVARKGRFLVQGRIEGGGAIGNTGLQAGGEGSVTFRVNSPRVPCGLHIGAQASLTGDTRRSMLRTISAGVGPVIEAVCTSKALVGELGVQGDLHAAKLESYLSSSLYGMKAGKEGIAFLKVYDEAGRGLKVSGGVGQEGDYRTQTFALDAMVIGDADFGVPVRSGHTWFGGARVNGRWYKSMVNESASSESVFQLQLLGGAAF